MKITKAQFPAESLLLADGTTYDYADSFRGIFTDKTNQVNAAAAGKAFFTSAPDWIGKLFELRNKMVAAFGLKTSGSPQNRQELLDKFNCEPGEQLGLFKVFARTENEVILGEDDKHLNFRISLFLHRTGPTQKALTISTTVQFNHWSGRLYFLPVRPFHRAIVPAMLKSLIRELEKQAN